MPINLPPAETRAWLALLRVHGLGPAGIRELLARHGSASGALHAARGSGSGAPEAALVDGDMRWLEASDHHLLVCTSEDFPALLRDIPGAPAALFVAGEPSCLW